MNLLHNRFLWCQFALATTCLVSGCVNIEEKCVPVRIETDACIFEERCLGKYPNTWTMYSVSDDGAHMAWVTRDTDAAYITHDGITIKAEYEPIGQDSFAISPDGKHLAYIATNADNAFMGKIDIVAGSSREPYLVIDNVARHLPYQDVVGLKFGDNGVSVGYLGKRDGQWYWVVDDRKRELHLSEDESNPIAFTCSKDLEHYAYVSKSGDHFIVVRDGQIQNDRYDTIDRDTLTYSADGNHLIFIAVKEGQWHAVVDSIMEPGYDEIDSNSIVLSNNGDHLSYKARKHNKTVLIVDRQEYGGYDMYDRTVFSPDGTSWACCAVTINQKRGVIILNGEIIDIDGIPTEGACFSYSGDDVAYTYIAKDTNLLRTLLRSTNPLAGKPVFVINGKAAILDFRDEITHIAMSPDGCHYA